MRSLRSALAVCSLLAPVLLAAPSAAQVQPAGATGLPPVPATPAVATVVSMRPFTLETPYRTDWRKGRPEVTAGWLAVIEADPAYLLPRQLAEPVLFVGRHPAERLNVGHASGRVVVIVPATVDRTGAVTTDLDRVPVFFGTPALPEQIDAEAITSEVTAAAEAGIEPPTPAARTAARAKGGAPLAAPDRSALLREAAALIRQHAPTETETAAALERQ